MKERLSDLAK